MARGKADVLQAEYFRRVGRVVLVKALAEFKFCSKGGDQIEIPCARAENLGIKKGMASIELRREAF